MNNKQAKVRVRMKKKYNLTVNTESGNVAKTVKEKSFYKTIDFPKGKKYF